MAEGGSDEQLVAGSDGTRTDYYLVFCEVHGRFHQVWFRLKADGTVIPEDIDA